LKRKPFVILAVFLVIGLLGVHVLRNEPTEPVPRRGEPEILVLEEGSDNVPPRASSPTQPHPNKANPVSPGQKARKAAREAFVLARDCAFAQRERQTIDLQLRICEKNEAYRDDPAHADFFAFCDKRALAFEKRLDSLSHALSRCGDMGGEAAEVAFYDTSRTAARLGDPDAQLCYVRANFSLQRDWTDVEKSAYKREASTYVAQAMQRGDWRFAELIRGMTPRAMEPNTLYLQIGNGDQVARYRYNRLLRLGARSANYRQFLDALIDDDGMSPEQKRSGDDWAQRTYAAHFARATQMDEMPDTCAWSPDDATITWRRR
jgi:hypothetical protein